MTLRRRDVVLPGRPGLGIEGLREGRREVSRPGRDRVDLAGRAARRARRGRRARPARLAAWLGGRRWAQERPARAARPHPTQLLLGEPVEVLEERDGWSRVAAPWQASSGDARGYPGWVRSAHLGEPVGRGRPVATASVRRTARHRSGGRRHRSSCPSARCCGSRRSTDDRRDRPRCPAAAPARSPLGRAAVRQGRAADHGPGRRARHGAAVPRGPLPVGRHQRLGPGLLRPGAPDAARATACCFPATPTTRPTGRQVERSRSTPSRPGTCTSSPGRASRSTTSGS